MTDLEEPERAAALAALPGLDLEAGLRTVGGREESLVRLLRKYAALHAEDASTLHLEMAAGRLESAERLAHSVKGAAGFLGLVGLQALAAELEAACRAGSAAPDLLDRFGAANQALCEAVIRGLPEAPRG